MQNKTNFPELSLSLIFGLIGGAVCGVILFSFTSLIGKSGTTGSEYVGAWNWGVLELGLMYGGFFGLLIAPLGYIIFLRTIGLKKGILPAAAGTVLGGCIGASYAPFRVLCYGCIGFFVALAIFRMGYFLREKKKCAG